MSRLVLSQLFFSLALLAAAAGCTKKSDSPNLSPNLSPNSSPDAAKAGANAKEVSIAIWSNYLSQEVQDKFTAATGIKLRVSNYASNEELLAKVQAGAAGIDVAVPSDYMVDVMIKLGVLQPLDAAKIPNRAGLDPGLLKQSFDPENKYSLPYAWSTAGIAVNRELFKGSLKSWKDLFTSKELAGKFSLLDDVREVTGAALKMNGFSVNSVNQAELDKAKATLKDARPRVKMYRSDTIDPLVNKEIAVAHAFSSDALKAADKTNGAIEYVLPEEGGTRAIDNVVLLKSAVNVEAAHQLINFLLSKESNVAFVTSSFGGPVVLATRELLPPKLRNNPALFPSPAVLSKLERIHDVGDATKLYDRLWTEVKAE
jgi:spermidine/putrescine transport system substrate-binding protein